MAPEVEPPSPTPGSLDHPKCILSQESFSEHGYDSNGHNQADGTTGHKQD